jgi:multidrug efflux system membrane fusion protein
VPAAAIQHSPEGDYVWLVKPASNPSPEAGQPTEAANTSTSGKNTPGSGTVVMQPVVIDTTQGSMVVLKSGLQANQQVVVDGADKLQNDAKVSTTLSHRSQNKQQQQQLGSS